MIETRIDINYSTDEPIAGGPVDHDPKLMEYQYPSWMPDNLVATLAYCKPPFGVTDDKGRRLISYDKLEETVNLDGWRVRRGNNPDIGGLCNFLGIKSATGSQIGTTWGTEFRWRYVSIEDATKIVAWATSSKNGASLAPEYEITNPLTKADFENLNLADHWVSILNEVPNEKLTQMIEDKRNELSGGRMNLDWVPVQLWEQILSSRLAGDIVDTEGQLLVHLEFIIKLVTENGKDDNKAIQRFLKRQMNNRNISTTMYSERIEYLDIEDAIELLIAAVRNKRTAQWGDEGMWSQGELWATRRRTLRELSTREVYMTDGERAEKVKGEHPWLANKLIEILTIDDPPFAVAMEDDIFLPLERLINIFDWKDARRNPSQAISQWRVNWTRDYRRGRDLGIPGNEAWWNYIPLREAIRMIAMVKNYATSARLLKDFEGEGVSSDDLARLGIVTKEGKPRKERLPGSARSQRTVTRRSAKEINMHDIMDNIMGKLKKR